ncbi:hypothetical protein [Staphylococcus pseudoxylosus]|uniref:hypothetical protein n=1 Tax=Staphylococcus pseudoxylosus TaxID=2282419 RepID=UPI003906D1D8
MGFITNEKDMNYLKKNYDKFSKELAGAINGKPISATSGGSKKSLGTGRVDLLQTQLSK